MIPQLSHTDPVRLFNTVLLSKICSLVEKNSWLKSAGSFTFLSIKRNYPWHKSEAILPIFRARTWYGLSYVWKMCKFPQISY